MLTPFGSASKGRKVAASNELLSSIPWDILFKSKFGSVGSVNTRHNHIWGIVRMDDQESINIFSPPVVVLLVAQTVIVCSQVSLFNWNSVEGKHLLLVRVVDDNNLSVVWVTGTGIKFTDLEGPEHRGSASDQTSHTVDFAERNTVTDTVSSLEKSWNILAVFIDVSRQWEDPAVS